MRKSAHLIVVASKDFCLLGEVGACNVDMLLVVCQVLGCQPANLHDQFKAYPSEWHRSATVDV